MVWDGVMWCGNDVMMRRDGVMMRRDGVMMRDGVMVWVGMTAGEARIWRRPAAQEGTGSDSPAL